MKKTNLIITIIVGLVIFILVCGFSYILGRKTATCPEIEKPLAKYFETGVVQDISTLIGGQVVGISSRNLTLNKNGKEFTIYVREDAKISQLIPQKDPNIPAVKNNIKFEEIKVGDKVTAAGLLNADASLEINSVTVLPPWY